MTASLSCTQFYQLQTPSFPAIIANMVWIVSDKDVYGIGPFQYLDIPTCSVGCKHCSKSWGPVPDFAFNNLPPEKDLPVIIGHHGNAADSFVQFTILADYLKRHGYETYLRVNASFDLGPLVCARFGLITDVKPPSVVNHKVHKSSLLALREGDIIRFSIYFPADYEEFAEHYIEWLKKRRCKAKIVVDKEKAYA